MAKKTLQMGLSKGPWYRGIVLDWLDWIGWVQYNHVSLKVKVGRLPLCLRGKESSFQCRIQSLIQEDPRCCGATKSMHAQSCMTGFSVHGTFSGKNAGMSCLFLLQGIFPTEGSSLHLLCLLRRQLDSLLLSHLGSPYYSWIIGVCFWCWIL